MNLGIGKNIWDINMNDERINELARQATEDCMGVKSINHKKFAELIIQECVAIVTETAVDNPPNDLFYGYNLAIGKSVENIKEHFGVE
jgi:hypothetical protein